MKIYVSGGQFFADGFAVRRSFELKEGESRLISYLSSEGSGCASLQMEGGVIRGGSGLGIIRWKDCAELFPRPAIREERVAKRFSFGEESILVTCLSGDPSLIRVEGSASLEHETCLPILSPTLSFLGGQREGIVELRARCKEGEYLLMLSFGKGKVKVLLEECGEEITCVGNEVTVRHSLHDLAGRIVTTRCIWRGDGFDRSREIVCSKEHTFLREEMGRLLLEAVMAEDLTAMRALLSPSVADPRAVLDYFGKVSALRTPIYPASPTAIATLKISEGAYIGATYDFDFDEEGKIENIRCLDEE